MRIFHADKRFERFEDVTPSLLKKEGVKLLLCDLDNTLRLHSEKEPADELQEWVKDCKDAGVKIVIISNNGRKKMMQKFCKPISVDCVWWAKKPMSTKLCKNIILSPKTLSCWEINGLPMSSPRDSLKFAPGRLITEGILYEKENTNHYRSYLDDYFQDSFSSHIYCVNYDSSHLD